MSVNSFLIIKIKIRKYGRLDFSQVVFRMPEYRFAKTGLIGAERGKQGRARRNKKSFEAVREDMRGKRDEKQKSLERECLKNIKIG